MGLCMLFYLGGRGRSRNSNRSGGGGKQQSASSWQWRGMHCRSKARSGGSNDSSDDSNGCNSFSCNCVRGGATANPLATTTAATTRAATQTALAMVVAWPAVAARDGDRTLGNGDACLTWWQCWQRRKKLEWRQWQWPL
eukprot:15452491-Alexandrium_andersonii.AAC.4